ncbi:MAG: transcription elongation factor GreA [Candidatus Magasanikbacteria bacterium]|nr:transcription elongation factor GreA [Candidatus Magasanikbacteria bacterium]
MSQSDQMYLTEEGYKKLTEEHDHLKNHVVKEVAELIDTAKQQGDLSENAEYQEAKERMAFVQGRILELEDTLSRAAIIREQEGTKVVQVGTTVKVRDEAEREKEYTIVGSSEADPLVGRISNESPIGQSFLGRAVNEEVIVATPSGKKIKYTILEIK